jgi:hypothetical protein
MSSKVPSKRYDFQKTDTSQETKKTKIHWPKPDYKYLTCVIILILSYMYYVTSVCASTTWENYLRQLFGLKKYTAIGCW